MDSVVIKPSFISYFRFRPTNLKTSSADTTHFSFLNFTKFNQLRTSSISFCYKNPSNPKIPNPKNPNNYSFLLNPFWVLVPIFQTIRNLTSSGTQKWASFLQSYTDSAKLPDEFNGKFLHNGAFGVALFSVTSSAKHQISPFVATLAANPTFVSGLFAWFIAQSAKVFLNFFVERKWDLRMLFASGGMPSSHSALCTALTTSVALCHGVADSLFPVCLGFSLIVMYDAIGVRRHAGMQAEVLNMIVEDMFEGHPISQRKLKELLGHTPLQVVAGALLGIVVACICCQC